MTDDDEDEMTADETAEETTVEMLEAEYDEDADTDYAVPS